MKRYGVSFTPNADADFEAILHFIAADNPMRAVSFLDELRQGAIDRLETLPRSGPALDNRNRYLVVGLYVVIYRIDEAARIVSVVMVSEGHRDWRRLIDDR